MIAAMMLAAALVWLAIAIVAGMLVFRWQAKRWLQLATTLFVAWLPFWDVVPGYYLYQKAVREVGGVRIYRTVKAEGYLDLSETDCDFCWSRLRYQKAGYLEVQRTWSSGLLHEMEQGAGYYTYRLLPRDDERCKSFDSLRNAERLRSRYGLKERCVLSIFSPVPVSEYEVSSGSEYYGWSKSLWPVEMAWRRVLERESQHVLAESMQIYFYSWLGRQIGIPSWRYTHLHDGGHIQLRVEEILVTE